MPETAHGLLKKDKKGSFTLRDPKRSFRRGPRDVIVPLTLIRKYKLSEGAAVTGPVRKGRWAIELTKVDSVCGLDPADFQKRKPYAELTAISPSERFNLAACGEKSMRMIDLIAPIGKGTRGLIVSPPKAGKTVMLKQIANAISAADSDTRIIVLLIDERPEEVTYFRRSVKAEVFASTIDQSVTEHVELAELILANIRLDLECGRDVVVLVDSLTRLGRSFNSNGRGTNRTMSGGLSAGALEIPRRFFGLARNIENGGSITIIATILVDTGSRMDQLIFEEFKGTGNSEIILDRSLAEARIFPAIDLPASGTRKEEHLYSPDQSRKIAMMRRVLSSYKPKEVIESMSKMLDQYPTNEDFLKSLSAGT